MKNDFSSALMLSCHNEKHLKKIPGLESECIMLNLEDGVSKEEKPKALKLCGEYLDKFSDVDKMFVVRVNALDEGGLDEIEYLNKFNPDAIRVPKIKTKEDVERALKAINEDIDLHLSIETAESWNNIASLKIDARVTTYYLGVLDLFADMDLPHSMINKDNPTMRYLLSHFLITSLSTGVKPVSFVYQEYKNLDGFRDWLSLEKEIGFRAKGCISPDQVRLVNEVFSKNEKEIKRAKKVIKLFEDQRKVGVTGFVDSELGFIDEPIYKGALSLLENQ